MPIWITGKAVLKVLAQTLPRSRGVVPLEVLVNMYLDKHPHPPPEIEILVARILDRDGNP